ncbi:ABC transporter ATP-binding protein [Polaribacter sargassicola]|uniref:ABC transporter ATP-binding protein n=1 Tax=Polaribacter sargassicola TaxID=2836891 RepID=UPI001F330EAF|nr:ABC transporter ATP-binding protein [Polaribacter sp. DS7-9]MCG1036599.1 ATP-binding cassette domain-containing protein [Polaribacter sp. DS7-9]
MSKDVILKVENLSKQYRLGTVGTGTISHDLNRFIAKIRGKEDPYLKIGDSNDRASKGNSEYVWALKDINFDVKRGEVLGIIGKNGAGKSTLLKILSKVTGPTTGSIKSKGRIASLLEVGTGFHPEMTGRENIFLNGAILGMTKKEIASKLDEIISFSGCERYVDTPVKRYSSGMKVRLAFAVAAHLEPDILIVDEVLAVGDAEFQKKAIGKMQDISNSDGRTVLFVSHNMAAVKSLCTRGMLIENGKSIFTGDIENTIDLYLKNSSLLMNGKNYVEFKKKKSSFQVSKVEIRSINQIGEYKNSCVVLMGDKIEILIYSLLEESYSNIKASIIIESINGSKIAAIRSHEIEDMMFSSSKNFIFKSTIEDLNLMPGEYLVTIAIAENNNTISIHKECIGFNVVPNDIYGTGRIPKGNYLIYSKAKWELNQA